MKQFDGKALGDAIVSQVREFVGKSVKSLSDRVSELDERIKAIPAGPQGPAGEPGRDGKDGEPGMSVKGDPGEPGPRGDVGEAGPKGEKGDPGESIRGEKGDPGEAGKDADPALIAELVEQAVSRIPVLKGDPGDRGEKGDIGPAGKDAEPIHPDTIARMVLEAVAKQVAEIPKAKDGRDGRDAVELNILASLDPDKEYPTGTYARHKGGLVRVTSMGLDVIVNGIESAIVEQRSEREFVVKLAMTDGDDRESAFTVPSIIYREIWREGEYERGDVVTYSGSAWHCQEKTTDKPGNGSPAWKLMVKEGRPGKDGGAPADTHKQVRIK